MIDSCLEELINKAEQVRKGLLREIIGAIGVYTLFYSILLGVAYILYHNDVQEFQNVRIIFGVLFLAMVAGVFYLIRNKFLDLVSAIKKLYISSFFQRYHPETVTEYFENKVDLDSIIHRSELVDVNYLVEKDVITGQRNGVDFYISRVDLRNQIGRIKMPVFKGVLINVRIAGRAFPISSINGKGGLLKFSRRNYKNYEFTCETEDLERFEEALGSIFPFINYLIKNGQQVRLSAKEETITILLNSDIDYLDFSDKKLWKPMYRKDEFEKNVKQLNSIMFIVDSLVGSLRPDEILEHMELNLRELIVSKSVISDPQSLL